MSQNPIAALIERFTVGPSLLVHAVSGLSPDHEQARPGPGAWNIAEVVTHLADTDLVLADRIKRVIAEPNPTLLAFDETAWIDRLHGAEMPVEEAVNLIAANRQWMARILRRCEESDYARAGTHTEAGRKTLADLVVSCCNHMDHHLKFLYAKRANLGVSVYPRYSQQPNE